LYIAKADLIFFKKKTDLKWYRKEVKMEEIQIALEYARCYTNLCKVNRVIRNAGGFTAHQSQTPYILAFTS